MNRDKALTEAKICFSNNDQQQGRKLLGQAIGFPKETVARIAEAIYTSLKSPKLYIFFAPYEADPQLIMLQKLGLADVIVTIDSDLLTYGPKHVLLQYESYTKHG